MIMYTLIVLITATLLPGCLFVARFSRRHHRVALRLLAINSQYKAAIDEAARRAGRDRNCAVSWFIANGCDEPYDATVCGPAAPAIRGSSRPVLLGGMGFEAAVNQLHGIMVELIDEVAASR